MRRIFLDMDKLYERCIPVPEAGCWLWTGYVLKSGYGEFWYDKKKNRAHRVAYQMFKGELGADDKVLHTCDTPSCVNPDHLVKGTQADNMADMIAKGRAFHRTPTKAVIGTSPEGVETYYPSIKATAEHGFVTQQVSLVASGKGLSHKKYKWRYA